MHTTYPHLRKKFQNWQRKREENCRAFVSRLNNLYNSIEGKEEKFDHDQMIIEDQLLTEVKRMQDNTKIKILLKGLLLKFKEKIYLRTS